MSHVECLLLGHPKNIQYYFVKILKIKLSHNFEFYYGEVYFCVYSNTL